MQMPQTKAQAENVWNETIHTPRDSEIRTQWANDDDHDEAVGVVVAGDYDEIVYVRVYIVLFIYHARTRANRVRYTVFSVMHSLA